MLNFLYEIETKLYGKKYFHTVMCVHRYNMKSLKCIYFNETYWTSAFPFELKFKQKCAIIFIKKYLFNRIIKIRQSLHWRWHLKRRKRCFKMKILCFPTAFLIAERYSHISFKQCFFLNDINDRHWHTKNRKLFTSKN